MENVHFMSKKSDWETPQELFAQLNESFHFTLDVCATPNNKKCNNFFSPEVDGLTKDWTGVCWMNPPYGREIGKWIKKAYEESLKGAILVCLLPARTDTSWWHDYVMRGKVYFIRGRLKFSGHRNSAPFPSAVVVFGNTKLVPQINNSLDF